MPEAVCAQCGTRNPSAGGFCVSCGTYLEWVTESVPDPDGPAPGASGRPPATPAAGPVPRPPARSNPGNPGPAGAPAPAHRPSDDPRGRRAGLLAYRPLTASAVPGHTLAGPPTEGQGDPAAGWLAPPPGAPVDRTGGMCHRCGRVNPTGTRYCRCGHRLTPYEPAGPAAAAAPPESGARAFDRAMRAAGRGRRPRFDKPLGGRTRAIRGVGVAGLLLLALIPITPPGADAIGRLSGAAESLVPYGYQEVPTDLAAVDPADSTVPHYLPDYAVDQTVNRAWAVAWTDPVLPERCGTSTAPALVIGFADTADVSRVIVNAGLDPADPARAKQAVPAVIDLDFANGDCERLTLADDAGDQEFRVSGGAARQARVQIVAATPAKGQDKNADQPPLAALSEIRFYQG